MGGEQKPHDRWPLAIWWSILGIIAGMVLSSLLESSGRSFFVWNPGTITVGMRCLGRPHDISQQTPCGVLGEGPSHGHRNHDLGGAHPDGRIVRAMN